MTKKQNLFLWSGLAVIIGLIVWGIIAAPATPLIGQAVPGVSDTDHILGPKTAPVVLIEYSDFQCPACAQAEPVVKQVKEKYGDQLVLVYRHFPLRQIHKNAQIAAQASEAAQLQGKFWEYHALLFERQRTWSGFKDPQDTLIDYAQELGMNAEQFKTDLNSQAVKNRVNVDYGSGQAASIPGTPTFFLNGQRIQNPGDLKGFSELIDDALTTNTNS